MAWFSAQGERRRSLFRPSAHHVRRTTLTPEIPQEELRSALLVLAGLLEGHSAGDADEAAGASLAIASWAHESGHPATRLAFSQVAALARPDDPELALETGKLARDMAEYTRAETWLRKAVRVSRRIKDWSTYLWAYAGLAVLYARLGNYDASRVVAERVLRTARHNRVSAMCGWAFHHFFVLAAEAGDHRGAYDNARQALDAYGPAHPRLTVLAHDVARFWIEHGHFSRALTVFESAEPRIANPVERAIAAANVARAAAALGQRGKYQHARQAALTLQNRVGDELRAADVYATLAFADAHAGEWSLAEETAEFALNVAIQRRDADVQRFAEAALSFARSRSPGASPWEEEISALARQADQLACDLIESLEVNDTLVES
jgi:tetratricopeptide (TPR) repeat protein